MSDYIAFKDGQPIEAPPIPHTCRFCGALIPSIGYCSTSCLELSHSPIQVFEPVYGVEVQFLPPLRGWRVNDVRRQRVNGLQIDIAVLAGGKIWRRIERVGE